MATYTLTVTGEGNRTRIYVKYDSTYVIAAGTYTLEEGTILECYAGGYIKVNGTAVCDYHTLTVDRNINIKMELDTSAAAASLMYITYDESGSSGNHKTLIDGTGYNITSGKTLINGTGYDVIGFKTLLDGTAYDHEIKKPTIKVTIYDSASNTSYSKYSIGGVTYTPSAHQTLEVEIGTKIICYVKSNSSSTALITYNGTHKVNATSTSWKSYSFTATHNVGIYDDSSTTRGYLQIGHA